MGMLPALPHKLKINIGHCLTAAEAAHRHILESDSIESDLENLVRLFDSVDVNKNDATLFSFFVEDVCDESLGFGTHNHTDRCFNAAHILEFCRTVLVPKLKLKSLGRFEDVRHLDPRCEIRVKVVHDSLCFPDKLPLAQADVPLINLHQRISKGKFVHVAKLSARYRYRYQVL